MRVKLDNIGKKYEGRENFTIRHINLEIKDKQFCAILGPSGCGKSTLLRMIAGLNSITEGELIFGDKLMNKVQPKDRDIAMVFQSYALYPHLTVYDNMAFSLQMKNERKEVIHKRVLEAADILQLNDYLYSKPSDISGGQRQRVALGRAMVRKPAVFLMDEPLSNLDAKLREHMRVELVRLHKQLGTTSIYVTHDQTEAMTMADKIILMNDGKIQQDGAPEEFYNSPANLFVARFIGSPTMNIFKGKFENGQFISDNNLIKITPSEEDSKKLKAYEGKNIFLGIRAERFLAQESENSIKGRIDVIEMLGKEKLLYVKLDDESEVVISQPGHFVYGIDEIHNFTLESDALHFFDGETEERIN
ncbi:ABC transporter ATP-binding protein [Helcococcus kunzii]|uniref:ABC transporter ATP-binding protein n=1 Tax=Helcococcus kunzii TaxID=40091 RepID=UPI001BB046F5|nr:sn-glycerol-3-phosphate ABC transporter ATP-binding protein UgpC [Helcococcus kunzii]MCT1795674.1 sn-glycerol-3-phosphate ABC transporter ATP-binding protein UgpC [Helcococcus kunzii]MCT1988635.1 sn-glycerol-3-phosphate ABC transporter ATP-binding protein UgpC [Helcococcus kunzii]QUY64913.1 sn-glycerol-3-phosphate ABC transporter ATP-binding protein UgpC [Helcococcus kunzii]QZO75621.1 sn-glycerol-3-phosphate ABC transporter ATP-binding protein UgpC [Helcococcus kunzii]